MEAQPTELPEGCLQETFKGNLHIRLFQTTRRDGSLSYLVELAAWNDWAGQSKTIYAEGGLDHDRATEVSRKLSEGLAGYDWVGDELLLEDQT
jgi:hypothetical protein